MQRSNADSSGREPPGGRALALVGPTASGKTAVGILLAEALGTEIIGCDSRQVYRRLDVGTAKPTAEERRRVRHHLVDVVDPETPFNAARYRERVLALLPELLARARRPLFVGGTGLYLRAALEGLCPAPTGQPALRRWFEALAADLPPGAHALLERVDPAAAARIHRNDRHRVLRALEVYFLGGEPLSERQRGHRAALAPPAAAIFALDVPAPELRRRLEQRLEQMMADGFLEEARALLAAGLDEELPALRSVGYPELFAHLRGRTSLAEAVAAIAAATWQYARRQLTWFRAIPGIQWVDAGPGVPPERAAAAIIAQLRREGAA